MAGERVAVIGAGIGGLAVALALDRSGREVVIVERDPQPPVIAPHEAFERWARAGVPQFRHAHIFLGRLQKMLRARHPQLFAELLDAGMQLSALKELLPPTLRDEVEPTTDDEGLLHLWGRRATFEYVLRRHVERLPHVRFVHGARAVGLHGETDGARVYVRGVEIVRNDQRERLAGELVIDASGKNSKAPKWLQALGVAVEVQNKPSRFAYACRHYRLNDPRAEPPRLDGGGNLDYLGYSTFYAEDGHYALTFGCPDEDAELTELIRSTEGFEALCGQFPVLEQRTSRSEATSKVLCAGRFENRWTHFGARGGAELLGFFGVGDSHFETNPMYGRGCASAFVQAHVLAEALAETQDAGKRAALYRARTRTLLQPYFEISVTTDHIYHVRADLCRGAAVALGDRIFNYLYERAFVPASRASQRLAREFLGTVQMREVSSLGRRLSLAFPVLYALVLSWLGCGRAALPPAPPPRAEFLRRLSRARDTQQR